MDIQVIRSQRKTLSVTLKPEGLVVRAPLRASAKQIQQFIDSHQKWIKKAIARQEQRQLELAKVPPLTDEDIRRLTKEARACINCRDCHKRLKEHSNAVMGRLTSTENPPSHCAPNSSGENIKSVWA